MRKSLLKIGVRGDVYVLRTPVFIKYMQPVKALYVKDRGIVWLREN